MNNKKHITELLVGLKIKAIIGDENVFVSKIYSDSRLVDQECLFVAVRGTTANGHYFTAIAIDKGANVIVCEEANEFIENVLYIIVENSAEALGIIASNFYDKPSEKLKLVGITGTNGKTTTATLLYELFYNLGYPCGLISTINICINGKKQTSTHTTPDAITLNKNLFQMVEACCEYCFMEVSSHAVSQFRIAGLSFCGAAFTNLTHDHLDYHKTFSAYLSAKKSFFDALPKNAFAIVNFDDKNGQVMLQNTSAKTYGYALKTRTDFFCTVLENSFSGMLLKFNEWEVCTQFTGNFNAYNLLLVYAISQLLNLDKQIALESLSKLKPVCGRFETLQSAGGVTAIVDYAHTPDALLNVLNTIEEINSLGGQIITVIGAGGNRDKSKRPIMAEIAVKKSSKVILTCDNPRMEDPEQIIEEMKTGIEIKDRRKMLAITDRKEAIRTAVMLASEGDIILIAGKGHETYQEVKGVRHHFDDKEIVLEMFNNQYN